MAGDPVPLGVALLARLEHEELSMKAVLDRLEAITTTPRLQREILSAAEREGVIEREEGSVRPQAHVYVDFTADVISKEGDFDCARCGADLSTGYFIDLDPGEVGPYGSTCIRKVTGRE